MPIILATIPNTGTRFTLNLLERHEQIYPIISQEGLQKDNLIGENAEFWSEIFECRLPTFSIPLSLISNEHLLITGHLTHETIESLVHNTNYKIIATLRNPIDWAISYLNKADTFYTRYFSAYVRYVHLLSNIENRYLLPLDLIELQDDEQRVQEISKLFDFLGLNINDAIEELVIEWERLFKHELKDNLDKAKIDELRRIIELSNIDVLIKKKLGINYDNSHINDIQTT